MLEQGASTIVSCPPAGHTINEFLYDTLIISGLAFVLFLVKLGKRLNEG